ncbi:MAG: FIST C-terminal domain-containing protein [Nitriliruptoraceae bacterium]
MQPAEVRTAAALSRTAEAGLAAAEAADAVAVRLSRHGDATPRSPRCDLVVVAVTPEHLDHLGDVAAAVEARLEPGVLLGAVATTVVGSVDGVGQEIDDGPAVSVWALAVPGGWVQPFRAWTLRPRSGGVTVAGWPDTQPGDTIVVLGDPHTFPAAEILDRLRERHVQAEVVGGLVSAGPDATRFVLDGRLYPDGAVGVVLRDVPVTVTASIGCRAIGRPVTVTEVVGDRVLGLAGGSATDHLDTVLRGLSSDDLQLLERGGLQLGIVADDVSDRYRAGDFLLRGVLGIDPELGAITLGDQVRVGATVQFHLRDPVHAGIDLTARLHEVGTVGGALLFTCLGRGRPLFGVPHHDARAVAEHLEVDVAGVACDGEIGPLHGRNVLHGFSAVIAGIGGPPRA